MFFQIMRSPSRNVMAADPNSRGAARERARNIRRDADGFVRAKLNHGGCYWRVTEVKNPGAWDRWMACGLEFREPKSLSESQQKKRLAAEGGLSGKHMGHD
jgi:hypothetical protein